MSRGGDALRAACVTGLGSGLLRPAPGTWGSLVGVVLFVAGWWLVAAAGAGRVWVELPLAVGVAAATWLAAALGPWAEARYGRADPQQFTLDEVAGQWVALLGLPAGLGAPWVVLAVVAGGQFVLFRLLDIVKPAPARQAERLPGGWGIVCDDLVAGAYANLIGQVLWRLTPLAGRLDLVLAAGPGAGS